MSDLVPTWTGSSWRDIPPDPQVLANRARAAASGCVRSATRVSRVAPDRVALRARMWDALPATRWTTAQALAGRLGLPREPVRQALRNWAKAGKVELHAIQQPRGNPQWFYRRKGDA